MNDVMTLRLRTAGRPTLVVGTHPDAERLLAGLRRGAADFAGMGVDLPPGVQRWAPAGVELDITEAVGQCAFLVILDPAESCAEEALAAADARRVPAWVPNAPERGTAEPALPPLAGGATDWLAEAEGAVHASAETAAGVGDVSLVGAGPGAPDLLTLRGLRALQTADVVIFDRLVAEALLEQVPPHCERIYVGKRRRDHPVPQEEINTLLLRHARAGKRVVRLKGGDPFIFGRGGEEIEHLMEAGIPFRVIPGITAASGCAAYAGIPLTHRDYAQSCAFVTGHRKDGELDLDFRGLVRDGQTLVFYMGLHSLRDVCAGLIAEGMAPEMPAAMVQQGTTRAQAVIEGTVSDLPEAVEGREVRAPTLLIIGEVVRLRRRLGWFHGSGEAMAWASVERERGG